MGIFNKNIFDELEAGIKDFKNRMKENLNEDTDKKDSEQKKCPNCGAMLENGKGKCQYCGLEYKSKSQSNKEPAPNSEKISYPVLVQYENDAEGGFYAYDCQTDTGTDCYRSVAKALDEIKKELQDILDGGYKLKFWTEEDLSKKIYAKSQLKKGAKIKFIELEYLDPENDPDW